MKVLLASPFYHQVRGNKVTVERIAKNVASHSIQTKVISSTDEKVDLESIQADLFHGFHAYRFYELMNRAQRKLEPYILTLTGTDFNHDLLDASRRGKVIEALSGAKGIHVFNEEAKLKLLAEVPRFEEKLYVIPQGVTEFPKTTPFLTKEKNTFLFILPAGIRQVKNVPGAIRMLSRLRDRYPNIRLWIIGPIIEEEEGKIVQALVADNQAWITYAGEHSHEKMGAVYEQGDIILNTSISEGQPSSILEAMAMGIPTLVSENGGNQSLVTHGKTGLIYKTEAEFSKLAQELIENPPFRKELGRESKQFIASYHSAEQETEKIVNLYKKVTGTL